LFCEHREISFGIKFYWWQLVKSVFGVNFEISAEKNTLIGGLNVGVLHYMSRIFMRDSPIFEASAKLELYIGLS
jgi:hypothetical protein